MPIPRRVRSFHGPHTTCLHAACGPLRTSHLARTKYNNFDVYVKTRWLYGFIRFLLYFSCSLFTAALWGALAALFCLQYLGVRVLLRFQLKLSVLLLLLGRRRVDFRLMNELLIYGIHVTMLLVGGLGWCFMVFVEFGGPPLHGAPVCAKPRFSIGGWGGLGLFFFFFFFFFFFCPILEVRPEAHTPIEGRKGLRLLCNGNSTQSRCWLLRCPCCARYQMCCPR